MKTYTSMRRMGTRLRFRSSEKLKATPDQAWLKVRTVHWR